MSHADQTSTASSGSLQFGCPSCQQELTIPANLAGVEGPCPHCHTGIGAPIPAIDQPARVLVPPQPAEAAATPPPPVEAALSPPLPPPPVTARPVPAALQPQPETARVVPLPSISAETRHIACKACGCELAIDPSMAHLPGGPCPRCQTWIDLAGNPPATPPPVAPPKPAPVPPPAPEQAETPRAIAPPARRRSPSSAASEPAPSAPSAPISPLSELNQTVSEPAQGMNFPKLENLEAPSLEQDDPSKGERRVVKRRKRKRQLPPEFYVGHAAGELDARGQESSGKMRRSTFPSDGKRREDESSYEDQESGITRWLPVFFGILIPLLAGLFAMLHFDLVRADDLRFWEKKPSQSNPSDSDLAASIERMGIEIGDKAQDEAIRQTFRDFLQAETWEEAETHLSLVHLPENSEASSFLKMFPREAFRGAEIKLIDRVRIPKTERFIFTTHVSNGIDDFGNPLLTFFIGEQQTQGPPKIHALQLYQSWKETLTEFLETAGAPGDRFYLGIRLADSENGLILPEDGEYVKLEIQDLLVKHIWTKAAYVRKDSYAGTRLLNTLTEGEDFSKAVVDLEWLKGPTGDTFVHVAGIHSSNWGDFPK